MSKSITFVPFTLHDEKRFGFYGGVCDSMTDEDVCAVVNTGDDAKSEALLHLFAAAPELLQACKLALAVFEDCEQHNDEPALTLRAAIAKAEGGAV